jgi:ribonuclease P protein component
MARFTPRARLHKPDEFKAVFERGRRLNERWLSALVSPNGTPESRLGLAVPKKIARRAVDRNRIKRHIRESFRQHQAQLPAVDVVILARNGSAEAQSPQLREVLDRLWNRIAAQCAPPPSS